MSPDDYAEAEEVFDIWPENMDSFRVFTALSTQWRPAYSGVIGFDYTAIHPVLRLMNIKRAAWADIFDDLRSMEQVAKKIINKGN